MFVSLAIVRYHCHTLPEVPVKLIGNYAEIMHMLHGRDRRHTPYVTRAIVSALGYIPGKEPEYRLVTSYTPEARKAGCLEIYRLAVFKIEDVTYVLIMYDDGIPELVVQTDIREMGLCLFSGESGEILFSSLVNRDPVVKIALLIDFKKKGWKMFPVDAIDDFSVSPSGRLAVIAHGSAGFLDTSDLINEVSMRATISNKQLSPFTLHASERVRVPDGSMLTRYIRPNSTVETFAVYRDGQVKLYDERAKLVTRIPEKDDDLKHLRAESSLPVENTFIMTDEVGNERRLEMILVEDTDEVPLPDAESPRRPVVMKRKSKQVRRVRSSVADVETVTRTPPTTL